MSTTEWLKPLQHILNCPVHVVEKSVDEWNALLRDLEPERSESHREKKLIPGERVETYNKTWIVCAIHGDVLELLEMDGGALSETEKELISWTMQYSNSHKDNSDHEEISEAERNAIKLSEWIQKQLESAEPAYSLPDHLTSGSRMFNEMIPFLLVTEQTNTKLASYKELEKLLSSYLADDLLLIPLNSQEWLIWGPMSLLKDEDAELLETGEEETLEDSLESIAYGLNEMLASEWLGECHLAVAHPVAPSKGMVETTILLRETINLGRKFHVGTTIHLPWMLHLERILNAIPESQRTKYLEQSLKRTDLFVEAEMLATLETFFSLDCNVSETAKKLYIHRNTLLYRLDKLKQDTGLDVRQFRDAVLVNIILLLYKVTKRN